MTQPAVFGRRSAYVPGPGGGEGPWYTDAVCHYIVVDVVDGDEIVLWADGVPSVTGPADVVPICTGVNLIIANGDGTLNISRDSCVITNLLAHKLPVPAIETGCT